MIQFQKSVIVVPAKTRHAVKRSAIRYFRLFSGHWLRRCDAFQSFWNWLLWL